MSLFTKCLGVACVVLSFSAFGATHYVSPDGNHTAPFLTWETAATNIQSAIASTTAGDLVLVTNGIYATGGVRTSASDPQTNRVALTNAIIVRSVNGPKVTIIEGAKTPGTTNGVLSVRCAYLASGATLEGFTLRNGATTQSGLGGGGIYCADSSSTVTNCVIRENVSYWDGGGIFGGTVWNSLIEDNLARVNGGGSMRSTLNGCIIRGNSAYAGGGAYGGFYAFNETTSFTNCAFVLNKASQGGGGGIYMLGGVTARNCTIVNNISYRYGGGVQGGNLLNCIVYYNSAATPYDNNFYGSSATSSCITPLPTGGSNISTAPSLLPDLIHLQPDSPCIARGTPFGGSGVDVDGSPWKSAPSIGCDEWYPEPLAVLASPRAIPSGSAGDILLSFPFAGMPPSCQWFKDGLLIENNDHYDAANSSQLLVKGFGRSDAGLYQVLATNAYGSVTSQVMQVSVSLVDAQSQTPAAPYTSWETAANRIQDAVDAALGTTVILVTNGVYSDGSRFVSGYGTNRVVLDKPVTLASLNGPTQTVIEGAWDPISTNGLGSVRCVWLGAEAFLTGFTLRNGSATNHGGGLISALIPLEPRVMGSVITNCSAKMQGGGVFRAWVADCYLVDNSAASGGAIAEGKANNSALIRNYASDGAGAYKTMLESCQVTHNFGSGVSGGDARKSLIATNSGAGVSAATAENCRIIGNTGSGANSSLVLGCLVKGNLPYGCYSSTNVNCTIVANGIGIIPVRDSFTTNCLFVANTAGGSIGATTSCILQPGMRAGFVADTSLFSNLLTDLEHIAANSSCIGRGTSQNMVRFDIDGQPFADPPSIGCDEWSPELIIAAQPRIIAGGLPGEAVLFFDLAGDAARCWWSRDGAPIQAGEHYAGVTSNSLKIRNFGPLDIGDYQVVASNSFGVVTSAVVSVKLACVDPKSPNAIAPYNSWQTAATTIQEAVDVADPQTVVMVTNGVYASGTRAVGSDTPNRLVVDKSIVLMSANGAENTIIEGAWDPVATNGANSVRCARLAADAVMIGFTFRNGSSQTNGGGVRINGTWPIVNLAHCILTNCSSAASGGGVFNGHVQNSVIAGNFAKNGGGTAGSVVDRSWIRSNRADYGGGVYDSTVLRSRIHENTASFSGGGARIGQYLILSSSIAFNAARSIAGVSGDSGFGSEGTLYHCTIVSNTAWGSTMAGVYQIGFYNSIVYYNSALDSPTSGKRFENIGPLVGHYDNVCSPFPTNSTNGYVLNALPQLLDSAHLASTSPCIAAGTPLGNLGFDYDIDGEPWGAKPSMGCDEFYPSGLVGPLSVTVVGWPKVAAGGSMPLAALIDGKATGVQWDFGDGIITNQVGYNPSHAWSAPGNYTVTATVYNTDHAQGVSASLPVEVIPFTIPELGQPEISGTNFQMSFSSQPGLTYEVYTATNLAAPIDWKLLKRLYSTGESVSISDTNAPAPAKFYRLEVKP